MILTIKQFVYQNKVGLDGLFIKLAKVSSPDSDDSIAELKD
jgi:hypothetical protein